MGLALKNSRFSVFKRLIVISVTPAKAMAVGAIFVRIIRVVQARTVRMAGQAVSMAKAIAIVAASTNIITIMPITTIVMANDPLRIAIISNTHSKMFE